MIGVVQIEEIEPGYKSVYVDLFNGVHQEFSTGDIVIDFAAGLKFAQETGKKTYYSSNVDNFLMDNDNNYRYDENNMIVKNSV